MRPVVLATLLALPHLAQAQAVRPPAALTLDTVLARHATAVGPLRSMQTRRTTTKVRGMAPFDLPVMVEAMRPNLLRKEVSIQGAVQITGFDGRDAWRIDPFVAGGEKPTAVPAAELTDLMEEVDFDGPLFNAAAKGHRLAYIGPSMITVAARQVPVHSIRVTFKGGLVTVVHLDASTYLEIQRRQTRPVAGSNAEITVSLTDYRTTGGIRLPYLIEITANGLPAPIQLILQQVEWNVTIDRRRFSRTGPKP